MRKAAVLVLVFLLGVTGVAIGAQTGFEADPGLILPDSPLYRVEAAWENAAVSIGLMQASEIVQERAAEAIRMAEDGKPDAAEHAADDLTRVAKKADGNDTGIEEAITALDDAMNRMQNRISTAPNDNARDGMQNALDNMQNALDNLQDAKDAPGGSQPDNPQDVTDTGNCEQEIGIAQEQGDRQGIDCTDQYQVMQCDDNDSVTYGAANGCEISALSAMGWTETTGNTGGSGGGCDTTTCTWDDYGCGNHGCPADKMARGRECNDQDCEVFKTRCVESPQCTTGNPSEPAVEQLSPQPGDDAFVTVDGDVFSASPQVPVGGTVEFANKDDSGQDHTITVLDKEYTVKHDWVVLLKFNREGQYTIECTTCSNATTTVTAQ